MGKKKIVTEKAQHSSTRAGGKTTRGERPAGRGALQRYGGPAGRIHRGPLDSELVEAFKKFEWTSHVMLETANRTDVLARIFVKWGRITAGELTRWFKEDEFYHLALLELADWEVHTLPFDRPTIAQVSDLVQREAPRDVPESAHDPVGNSLVSSARILTGTTLLPPPLKPPPKIGGVKTPRARGERPRTQQRQKNEGKTKTIDLTVKGRSSGGKEEAPGSEREPGEERQQRDGSREREATPEEKQSSRRQSQKRRSRSRSREVTANPDRILEKKRRARTASPKRRPRSEKR